MKRLLSRLFGSRSRSARPKPARRPRLGIEALEDRQLMAAGFLDPTFGSYGWNRVAFDLYGGVNDQAQAVALQPDGKIVVAGFAQYGTSIDYDFAITRFHPNGTLDYSFGTNGKVRVAFDLGGYKEDKAEAVAIDAYGRIVVAGTVERGGGNYDFGVTRLHANGSIDFSFGSWGRSVAAFDLGGNGDDTARDMTLDVSGRILVVGRAQYSGYDYDFGVVRLTPDGWFDPSFSGDGKATIAFDRGGGHTDIANAVALDAYGRIVVAGSVATSSNWQWGVTRLGTDGSLDWSFGSYGQQLVSFGQFPGGSFRGESARDLAIDGDGRIVLAGDVMSGSGFSPTRVGVARLTPSGSLDPSFGWYGVQVIDNIAGHSSGAASAVAIDAQGRIVVAGRTLNQSSGYADTLVIRLTAGGWLDTSFGPASGRSWFDLSPDGDWDWASDVVLDASGDIILVGASLYRRGTMDYDFLVARLDGG